MNSRDNDREFGAMLRRGLASSATAPESECLDAALLAAYFERGLAADEMRACDVHVANCANCRSQLAAMARAEPELAAHNAPSRSWLFDWRLLVPVTAALTALVVWVGVRRPLDTRNVSTPIVAQNQAPPAVAPAPPPSSQMVAVQPPSPAPSLAKKLATPSSQRTSGAHAENRIDATEEKSRTLENPGNAAADRKQKMQTNDRERGRGALEGGASGSIAGGVVGGVPQSSATDQATAPAPQQNAQLQSAAGNVGTSTQVIVVQQQSPATPAASPAPTSTNTAAARPAGKYSSAVSSGRSAGFSARAGTATGAGAGGAASKPSNAAPQSATAAEAAPAPVQPVTARYKQDESKPIVIPTPDSNTFWRVAGADEIQFTNDVGVTWQSQLTEPNITLTAGSAPKANICWVVGNSGTIFRTIDGENWRPVKSPTSQDLTAVTAQDADHATITAKDGSTFTTDDGGANWTRAAAPSR